MQELNIVSNLCEIFEFNAAVDSILRDSPTKCSDIVGASA